MSAYDKLSSLCEDAPTGTTTVTVEIADLLDLLSAYMPLGAAPAKKPRAKKAAPASISNLPSWLPLDAWAEFLAMRVKIKKPATEYAQQQLLKKLAAFYAADLDPGVILNNSIMNCWLDLYAPKDQTTAYRGARPAVADQNRQNNAEALRLLGQPTFYPDDGMTLEAMP